MTLESRDGARPTFLRSGGWVLVAALVLTGAVFTAHVVSLLGSRTHAVGDGKNPATYGFDLADANVPAADIVAAGFPKDGLPALVAPAVWTTAEVDAKGSGRGKLLVPSDRVIGVRVGAESRAYPLRLLVWHEVVNDTLGGRSIAVAYNPLCDSAVVFDRIVAGSALTFGVSGLLYQSNLLMYDRQARATGESLWSQLLVRAVAGPAAAAGRRLDVLPSSVATWADWRAEHPATTVLAPDPRLAQQYKRDPYSAYFGSDLLRFPVRPLPPTTFGPRKTPIVVLYAGGVWHAFPFPAIDAHADPSGRWRSSVGPAPVDFRIRREHPQTVEVSTAAEALPTIQTFLFAWWATHASDTVWHL